MQQNKVNIREEDYNILKNYIPNIDEELKKGITEFLFLVDNIMSDTLDRENNYMPTKDTLVLERIYDTLYQEN